MIIPIPIIIRRREDDYEPYLPSIGELNFQMKIIVYLFLWYLFCLSIAFNLFGVWGYMFNAFEFYKNLVVK